jgi:hypothetical protein
MQLPWINCEKTLKIDLVISIDDLHTPITEEKNALFAHD